MWKSWSFIGIVFLLSGICGATDNDYEYASGEPFDGNSLEIYRYFIQDADNENVSSSQESWSRDKREIVTTFSSNPSGSDVPAIQPTARPKVLLSDIIGRVEGSIFQSALSAVTYAEVSQNHSDHQQPFANNTQQASSSIKRSINPNDQDTLFKYVTTRSVPPNGDQPGHIIIDRVAVSEAKSDYSPLLTSLNFRVERNRESSVSTVASVQKDGIAQVAPVAELTIGRSTIGSIQVTTLATPTLERRSTLPDSSVTGKTIEKEQVVQITPKPAVIMNLESTTSSDIAPRVATVSTTTTAARSISDSSVSSVSTSSSTTSQPSLSTVSSSSATSSPSPTTGSSSTSPATSTSATSASTTPAPTSTSTKTPIEKLKEEEEDLKEKVAEIEAEPIILSARV